MALSAFLLAALVGRGQTTPTAEEALRRCMERRSDVNVDAILEQMSPWGNGYIRVRLWCDTTGKRRTEILSPVAMRGQVSVDDGTVWTTYLPDERKARSHPSPMLAADDLDFRMHLVKRNYQLEIDDKPSVAGRPTLRIVARPRASELEARRFYVDAATYLPLKIEAVNDLGGVTVQMAVRRVEYPSRLDQSIFGSIVPGGARWDHVQPPQPLKNADDAERRAGFRPAFPRRLPMGFRVQGMDAMDRKGKTSVGVRITDGLVRLFVYQGRVPESPPPARSGDDRKTFRDVGDIRIEVRGDVPTAVRERILAVYAKALEGNR